MKIYVMRHGTTIWNLKNITQGRSNNKLSQEGIELTQSVAENFKNTNIDCIFCSPLMRTVQTSNIMNKYHNVRIIKDENINHIDQGIFTGMKKSVLTEEQKLQKENRAKECGMESYESCYNRAKNFLDNLIKSNKYQSVLVVTHNLNASMLESILNKIDLKPTHYKPTCKFKNAEIKEFEL